MRACAPVRGPLHESGRAGVPISPRKRGDAQKRRALPVVRLLVAAAVVTIIAAVVAVIRRVIGGIIGAVVVLEVLLGILQRVLPGERIVIISAADVADAGVAGKRTAVATAPMATARTRTRRRMPGCRRCDRMPSGCR